MAVRRLGVCVMGRHDRDQFRSLMKHMQTVWTRPARASSMRLLRQKTSWCLVRTYPMRSLRRHPQNKVFTSDQTEHSTTGGYNIKGAHLSHQATLYRYSLRCRAIPNHRDFGKNTPTQSCETSSSLQQLTNHASTRAS
jgi:hypothetical protein